MPTMQTLKSPQLGGLNGATGEVILPPRLYENLRPTCRGVRVEEASLVMCHNDLGQTNIFVDPDTFEITGIIDWKHAGESPKEFELEIWKHRPFHDEWDAFQPAILSKMLELLAAVDTH